VKWYQASSFDAVREILSMRTIWILLGVALMGCGCSKGTPTQAGGKPVAFWIQELKNPDAKARRHAVAKLGNVGSTDPATLSAVQSALSDADAGVRAEAILALMKCGPTAKDAIPALTEMQTKDRDPQVREYARKALEKLRSENKEPSKD
jgi:HEAT repeat protein